MAKAKRRSSRKGKTKSCKVTRVNGKRRKICRDSKGRITSNRAA